MGSMLCSWRMAADAALVLVVRVCRCALCVVRLCLLRGAQGHSLRGMVAHPRRYPIAWGGLRTWFRGLGPEAAKANVCGSLAQGKKNGRWAVLVALFFRPSRTGQMSRRSLQGVARRHLDCINMLAIVETEKIGHYVFPARASRGSVTPPSNGTLMIITELRFEDR